MVTYEGEPCEYGTPGHCDRPAVARERFGPDHWRRLCVGHVLAVVEGLLLHGGEVTLRGLVV